MDDKKGFDVLEAAIKIFKKYNNPQWPFHCEHDVLTVDVCYSEVSDEDKKLLNDLGFHEGEDDDFKSYRFGSC